MAFAPKSELIIDRNHILNIPLEPLNLMSDEELVSSQFDQMIFDVECYPNYFLVAFKHIKTGKCLTFEISPDSILDCPKLNWVLWNFTLVGFNSNNYDLPMIFLALKGFGATQLKQVSDRIISDEIRARNIEKEYDVFIPKNLNHIDLIEVAPLDAGLKTYSGRLHCRKMQDLPFEPDMHLTQLQAEYVKHYCVNDLDNTELLFKSLSEQIKLRCDMSEQYGIDLRSKSDAQIAEQVICSEVAKINGHWPKRPIIIEGQAYRYFPPEFMKFKTELMQDIFEKVLNTNFTVGKSGAIEMPETLDGLSVQIGKGVYRMGIGGLHSSEESVAHKSDSEFLLIDRDVASYYPSIILNMELYPKHMGKAFLQVYSELVERRLAAKHNGNKIEADSLKITINGSFGKLGSRYSSLYSPDLLFHVTMTGQLSLLMLIESVELVGIEVVSANTDGIVIKCPVTRKVELDQIISDWEKQTKFVTEETKYKAIYCRDVNNYIAIKEDGKCKLKGAYSKAGLQKNPTSEICIDAVIAMLTEGIEVEQTIQNCKDVTKFLIVRNVRGGAHKDGLYLGKVVRFYFSTSTKSPINYVLSGNKVPTSDGAMPMMELDEFPNDIDFQKYISQTREMLRDLAYWPKKRKGLF